MDFNNPNAYGGQFANSPQHAQFDAQARLQQQANPHGQYGQAASFPGMGGAMGSNVIQQGVPYLQRGKPTASPASATGQQPFATPTPQPQQSPGAMQSNGHHHQPMNLQLPVKSEPPQLQTPIKQVPPSPVSPIHHARAQDRVATLLEINSILIREVCDLQVQGKAGPVGSAASEAKPEAEKAQPSKEYVDYMRRLQANLAYLAQNAEKVPKPGQQVQPGPAIMALPSAPAELVKLYTKLQDLFPGWKGGQTGGGQMKQSPGPQRSSSSLNMSQPPSAGLQPNWGQNAMQQGMQQLGQLNQQQQQQQNIQKQEGQ
ncbi:glutamine repeat -1 [Pyrenophora seminiperda CCB06]|uniref:Glutamine repeat-1 n=1 Tax=Pyrenophora seminiperda CCB06 TaxID=1302712 RepID=A0A3M7MC21_9PLEO|nr:glutamine repeat -1 [Pyrenophora seminiperda CCB06]